MEKWIEVTGRNEGDAIANALKQLGLDRDEVSVEVIDRAKSGFLGIGGTPAKVKVSYEAPDEPVAEKPAPRAATVQSEKPAAHAHTARVPRAQGSSAPRRERAPLVDDGLDHAPEIAAFLTQLMVHMGVAAKPSITRSEVGSYEVDLVGENMGSLIGRRGETLDAIQQITSYAVNKSLEHRCRIHVDAEQYRAKREDSLVQLAERVAAKVVKDRRSVTLEPMNAYERHVIHTALQENANVTTYSMGTEPNRRTVVACAQGGQTN